MPKSKPTKKSVRPYNRYNIYFILERENLITAKGGTTQWSSAPAAREAVQPGFENLCLPPFPSRFAHIVVPTNWCMPGQKKRRPHRKTHGVASFRDLAQSIAKSWKIIDQETLCWCATVEKIMKERHVLLNKKSELEDAKAAAAEVRAAKAEVPSKPEASQSAASKATIEVVQSMASVLDVPRSAVNPNHDVLQVPSSSVPLWKTIQQDSIEEFAWDPSSESLGLIGYPSAVDNFTFTPICSEIATCHTAENYSSLVGSMQQYIPTNVSQDDMIVAPAQCNFVCPPAQSAFAECTPMYDAAEISDDEIMAMWATENC